MAQAAAEATARAVSARYGNRSDALIEILHALQAELGFVPSATIPELAKALNLSRAEVHGVVTFYHDFRSEPAGRHVLKICRAEACQSMGGEALAAHVEDRAGVPGGGTSSDGRLTVEPVYCLGLCACAPAAMLDGVPVGRLTAAKVDDLLKATGAL